MQNTGNKDTDNKDGGYNATSTEAVAVFHDVNAMQAAIDELLMRGFDHAELSVLASDSAIKAKLGRSYKNTTEFEDDPDVPRIGYVPDESRGDAQGAIIGAAAYFPAVIGSLLVAGSGGTLLGAVAVAAMAGGAGAMAGTALAQAVGSHHAKALNEQLANGGILLWVRTHNAEHEQMALDILNRHGGDHVHLHILPPATIRTDNIPVRRPLWSFGPPN